MDKKEVKIAIGEVMENLSIMLIPAKGNEKMLQNVPHTPIEDMAMVYTLHGLTHVRSGSTECGIIDNRILNLLESVGIEKESLHWYAIQNAVNKHPARITTLFQMIREAAENIGMEIPDNEEDAKLTVVTNKEAIYGAAAIFYPGVMAKVADTLDGSFYILPSSIHEVICVPKTKMSVETMQRMVSDINAQEVAPEDRLTNSVYYYDAELETFDIVGAEKEETNEH